MTADLHAAALAAIAERRALIEAGTAGPWNHSDFGYAGQDEPCDIVIHAGRFNYRAVHDGDSIASMGAWDRQQNEDADLIVAAVNAFAADTDHMESVLKVWHSPGAPLESGALRCRGDHWMPVQAWPCPDARSVLAALGLEA